MGERLNVPLIQRYEQQKKAIKLLESEVEQARLEASVACQERNAALRVLEEIGQGRGKYARQAAEAAELIKSGLLP